MTAMGLFLAAALASSALFVGNMILSIADYPEEQ